MDRKSSDKVAHIASRIMRMGDPLADDALMDQIIANVCDAKATGTQDDAREALRGPLREYHNNARSLAASVVSQGDGPE